MNSPIPTAPVDPEDIARFIREDLGAGDLTALIVPAQAHATARLITREDMVLCGRPWFDAVFAQLDPAIHIDWQAAEGEEVAAGGLLCI
ncbi:MAG: nicotinate-nucleotide diphosphorylase, partial [Candidatus Methylumidiphilus sp.]